MTGRAMLRVLAVVGLVFTLAVPAFATDVGDVTTELELRGYFIDTGVDVDFGDLEDLVDRYEDVYFVALADDPSGGADLFASDALVALAVEGTVVVVSPTEVGARSTLYGDDDLDRAFDRSIDAFDSSYVEGFDLFAGALQPIAAPATTQPGTVTPEPIAEPSGGGSGGLIFLVVVVGIALLIWWAIRRSRRTREEMVERRVDEVKAEIQAQLSEAANDILELEDDILLSDHQEAKELYYAGSEAYSRFQEQLAGASSFAELDALAEGADIALWQLESAEALLEGREPPPKPEPRPGFEPPQPAQQERRHPDLPEDLQLRRERRAQRGTRPRQRSSGGLGGLGAAAVILRSLQRGRAPQPPRTTRRASGSSGVQVPTFGSSSRRGGSSSRSRTPRSSAPKPRGRARRRR